MNGRQVLAAAGEARAALIDELRALRPEQWDEPSLCAGWAVRDVVGHLIRLDDYYVRPLSAAVSVIRWRGLNRFLLEDARRRSAGRDPGDLVEVFSKTRYERRLLARFRRRTQIPLAEIVIHGQDICRAVGVQRTLPADQLQAVADLLLTLRYPWGRASRFRGIRLQATDAQWSTGDGPVATGPLEAIVMTLAGRAAAVADLSGEGVRLLRVS